MKLYILLKNWTPGVKVISFAALVHPVCAFLKTHHNGVNLIIVIVKDIGSIL